MISDNAYAGLGALVAVLSIWSVVGLAFYVWYLWALARLFPYLGLPKAHGWIPVYNLWRLFDRAGFPGWMVLLGLIPGLSILVLVMTILTVHRINREHGEGGGMTVLGAFIPPIWAMLLANRLHDRGHAPAANGGYPGGGAGWQQPSQLVEYGPDGQVYPLLGNTANAVNTPAAADGAHPNDAGWAMPAVPQHSYEQAPAHRLFEEPSTPQGGGWAPPAAPAAPAAPTQASGAPAQDNPWSLGSTIDGNFERLASEELPPRGASFNNSADARPFSWPEAQTPAPQSPDVPAAATPPAPPTHPAPPAAQTPPPQTPAPHEVPVTQQTPVQHFEAPVAANPVPAAPQFSDPQQPSAYSEPAGIPEVPVFSDAQAAAPTPAQDPAQAQEQSPSQPSSGMPVLAEPSVLAQYAPAQAPVSPFAPGVDPHGYADDEIDATVVTGGAVAPIESDEELDHTIMVVRKKQWVLELQDGTTLELVGDDVVIGRRPTAIGASATLLIPDSTRTLSKSHARLRRDGEQWTIEDLDSTNGVFVFDEAGEQVEAAPGAAIPASEQLIIGTLEVRLHDIAQLT